VTKVIFSSSVQVIRGGWEIQGSKLPYLPLDGDAPPNPANPYALSKVTGEIQLQYFVNTGAFKEAVSIRLPFLPSKKSRYFSAIPAKGYGNKLEAFAFLRAEDAAHLILKCLQTRLPGYRCYFPASTIPSNAESVQHLLATEYTDVPLKKPAAEITALVDCSRITQETGWEPPGR
jgi:nucleoside-diphosphate-sugar epimerase